ncbi:hypothetical protein YS110_22115 [Acidovorax sp. YS12]|nr:hypothetical protein YS110_22115 [Acidovorax sp. YS12]
MAAVIKSGADGKMVLPLQYRAKHGQRQHHVSIEKRAAGAFPARVSECFMPQNPCHQALAAMLFRANA